MTVWKFIEESILVKNPSDVTSAHHPLYKEVSWKYIKVSKVSYTYQGLELFAEVGGYLGLCLGISISQLPGLIASFVQKCNRK